jgi:hypothetical protein
VSGLRDDDGRRSPDPDGLPGLPEEWGHIVIPDDAAELDREAARVRRELRREALLRRYRIRGGRHHQLTLPLIVLALAILVTTTSLFAAMWPQHHRAVTATPSTPVVSATAVTVRTNSPLPDLTLVLGSGQSLRLRLVKPAVVLLMRGCACTGLVTDTVTATTGTKVAVLVVGSGQLPALPSLPADQLIYTATDPSNALANAVDRTAGATPAATAASALLVDAKGAVRQIVASTQRASDFSTALAALR